MHAMNNIIKTCLSCLVEFSYSSHILLIARVISLYNKVKSICRSSLKCQTMSDYLYINMNMPPLCSFDPRPATLQWMDEREHRTRNTTKAGEQEWFSKVFQRDDNPQNGEAEEGVKTKSIKRKFKQL